MRRVVLLISILGFAACGARTDLLEGDDDPDDRSDGDADSDPAGEGEGEGGGCWELDLGPDARPSDYPEADDWVDTDPSALGDGDPCCELVGGAVEVTDGQEGAGVPDVAWNGEGWGVLWADQGWLTFRGLDAFAVADGPPIVIGERAGITMVALAWAGCYGIVGSAWRETPGSIGLIDEAGGLLAGITYLPGEARGRDIARYAHGHGWIEVHRSRGEGQTAVDAVWVDDDAVAGDSVRIATAGDGAGGSTRVVGLRSLASFVWANADGVWSRSIAWPDVDAARPAWRVFQTATTSDTIVAAAAYRDTVAVAGIDGTVQLALFDPWTDQVVAGPTVLADDAYYDAGSAGIAPVEELGYLGVCYVIEAGKPDGGTGLAFVLAGPDAQPWGEPVTVTTGQRSIGGCAAAWSGSEFLVAWWQPGGDATVTGVFAQRVASRI